MELNQNHKNNINNKLSDFLKSHKPDFKKSKQSEWEQLQAAISRESTIPIYAKPIFKYAAMFLILISFSLLARYYSKNIYCGNAEHISVVLPDSSTVVLNADTKVSYNPIWWYIARNIKLEGEAYFEVKKGNKFSVISENGTTTVLGTIFNIFARKQYYNVSCSTGKVRVESNNQDFIITKGQAITSNLENGNSEKNNISISNISSWKNKKLIFTGESLIDVFEELERQYNVKIDYIENKSRSFSGSLSLNDNVKKNIDIICRPFFLENQKLKEKRYKVKEKRE